MSWNSVLRPSNNTYNPVLRDVSGFTLAQMTAPLSSYTMILAAFDNNDFIKISRPSDSSWNKIIRPS